MKKRVENKIRKIKKVSMMWNIIFSICLLTGCAYSNLSVMDIANRKEGSIKRSCSYWSGIQAGDRITLEKGEEIHFYVEMEKGSVTFILKDSEGNEVYSVTKEGEYTGTETYTAEKSDKLKLTEKGASFKGSYEITWGELENAEEE